MSWKLERIDRAVCGVWVDGGLTWIEAVATLRRRHLADLYALSYRRGILPRRPFAEEAALPTLWLTPNRWRRYPEWHFFWKQRLRDAGRSEDEIERTVRDLDAGIDVASRQYAHAEMWERMQHEGAAFSATNARRRHVLDVELHAAIGNRDAVLWLIHRTEDEEDWWLP